MHVLIVEDSMTMRRIIIDSLRSMTGGGTDVIEASTGEEALAILRATPGILLVLLDWHLPGMTGLEVIMTMQVDPELAKVPVVMVTAERGKENVIAALRAGARNYIAKPFTQAVFRRKVGAFLEAPDEAPGKESPRPAGSLVGNLSETQPMEVVQLISMTGKTGVLTFESPGGVYSLYFTNGQIEHAEGGGLSGEEAVEAASSVEGGTFSFRTEAPKHPTTVRRSTEMILLSALNRAAAG